MKDINSEQDNNFNDWFNTFLEEKGLLSLVIEFENENGFNYFPIEVIPEYLMFCSEEILLDLGLLLFLAHL